MKIVLKLIINALAVLALSNWFGGVEVDSFGTAILVAIILAILNVLIKPFLIIITIPITILTFGIFLLFVNAIIVKMASGLVDGFYVSGWLSAILFGLAMSLINSLLDSEKHNK